MSNGTPATWRGSSIIATSPTTPPDAPAWHHSHQRVRVEGSTFRERAEAGQPKVYRVKFADDLAWDAFEDEMLLDPKWFERDDPDAVPARRAC